MSTSVPEYAWTNAAAISAVYSPSYFDASAAEYSGIAPAIVDFTRNTALHANTPGGIFAIGMRCCTKILPPSSSNQIDKDQCEKLQKLIMNLDAAEKLDELFELTTRG